MRPGGCSPDCNACRHITWQPEQSLSQKARFVREMLIEWQSVISSVATVSDAKRFGYRRKACLSACYVNPNWDIGVRKGEEIIPIPNCPVHDEKINSVVNMLANAMPSWKEWPLAYLSFSGTQICFVLKINERPSLDWFFQNVADKILDIGFEGIWIHLHPSAGHRVFLKGGWSLIAGKESSKDERGLTYGPTSFQQLIPELHDHSVQTAARFLNPGREAMVVDLYCGTGATLRLWQKRGAHCVGVELSGEAIRYAALNAPGTLLFRGKCSERIVQLKKMVEPGGLWHELYGSCRLLYLNPPRTGLEPEVVSWIVNVFRPARMAYLSCSPGTLKRDLNDLVNGGYVVEALHPYDFFPQTHHIEVLALLGQKETL